MSPFGSSSSWSFRPSVLQEPHYHELKVDDITDYYVRDNERAEHEGVSIPPHPSVTTTSSSSNADYGYSSAATQETLHLRTAQWNIQAWRSPQGTPANVQGIQNILRQVQADVLILNEYHWNDWNTRVHQTFERFLLRQGYQRWHCGTNGTPTLVASKYDVLEYKEIKLSYERSALCLKLNVPEQLQPVWVIGTHLDHLDGSQRHLEMEMLLNTLREEHNTIFTNDEPVILAGDFNQQRKRDYTKQEWQRIAASMYKRKACPDDSVGTLLESQSFRCVFDQLGQQQQHRATFNWETSSLPPSTHWSGTTIDYTYTRHLDVQGVYISPAGYSDHRMTVCDWKVPPHKNATSTSCMGAVRRVSAEATTTSEDWNSGVVPNSSHSLTQKVYTNHSQKRKSTMMTSCTTSSIQVLSILLAVLMVCHHQAGAFQTAPIRQSFSRPTTAFVQTRQTPLPFSSRHKLSAEKSSQSSSNYDQGEVGEGSNWIEKSFPVETEKKIDIKKVDDYNLGICGKDFQTGSLSQRMFEAITSRTSLDMSDEIRQAFSLYAMDFTAKEAARAALKQNGLEMVLQEEEEDQGMWGDVEAIRLYDMATEAPYPRMYDSLEDAVEDWTPGQTFDFVARQVPAKMRELSVEELVQALDPDGKLREEAKEARGEEADLDEEALLSIFDEGGIASLADMANDCVERTEKAPRDATDEGNAYAGLESRGYRIIKRSDLLRDSINDDGTENEKTTMHVMNALVSHGVLIVDLTDGGSTFKDATLVAKMWTATENFFDKVSDSTIAERLPGMTTVTEAESSHAKVGYAEYDSGSMKFLETRRERNTGDLLPTEAAELLGTVDVSALQSAFDIVTKVGKDVVRVAVAAGSVEHGAFYKEGQAEIERDQKILASQAATLLVNELIDDGRPLSPVASGEGGVSMSPHRLCRYSEEKEGKVLSREVFGAHTDSSFVTIVPVAAVSGLEVYDEESEKWYRPELKARQHWEAEQASRGKDAKGLYDELDGGDPLPWHARYLAIMPGEFLQLATRDEVPSAVHRVVAAKGRPSRLSAPILLRGRPRTVFDTDKYLGGTLGSALLQDADGLSMQDIHDKCQPSSYQ